MRKYTTTCILHSFSTGNPPLCIAGSFAAQGRKDTHQQNPGRQVLTLNLHQHWQITKEAAVTLWRSPLLMTLRESTSASGTHRGVTEEPALLADTTEAQLLGSGRAWCRCGAFPTQPTALTPCGITLQQLQALFSSTSGNFLSFGGCSLVRTRVT